MNNNRHYLSIGVCGHPSLLPSHPSPCVYRWATPNNYFFLLLFLETSSPAIAPKTNRYASTSHAPYTPRRLPLSHSPLSLSRASLPCSHQHFTGRSPTTTEPPNPSDTPLEPPFSLPHARAGANPLPPSRPKPFVLRRNSPSS